MKSLIAAACLFAVALPAAAQDDERAQTLKLATKLKGSKVEFTGTVKMPDDCSLDVYLKREHEMLLYGKVECRIQPTSVQTPDKATVAVQKGKFSGAMQAGGPGFYRLEVMYSRFSQRSMDVVKTLGNSYLDWGRDFPLALLDGAIIEQLTKEREECVSIIASLNKVRDLVAEMIRTGEREKRDFKAIDKELKILEKKIAAVRETSVYTATLGVAADVAARLRSMSPANPKVEIPPGVDPAHYEAEAGDLMMGFSDERDVEIITAFISRTSQCLDRERLLFTYRFATAEFEDYLRQIRHDAATDSQLADNKKRWEAGMDAVKENSKVIEKELPKKQDRKANDELVASLCQKCNEMMERMDGYIVKRLGARGGSIESIKEMEEKEGKEVAQEWEKLDNILRRVASK